MQELKISVVVPSYNYEKYVGICIDSVLTQNYLNFELIVVDDCSSDSSRQIINNYNDKRLSTVFHEKNSGHGGAFNSGFEKSSGDIVMFLDADDFLKSGALQTIADNYEVDVAMYHYFLDLVDTHGNSFDIFPKREVGLESGNVVDKLCQTGGFRTTVTSGMAFSRKALSSVMPMDKNIYRQGADGYLSVTVPLYGPVKALEPSLANYRQHGDNHSKFGQAMLKRAGWCVSHIEDKFASLQFHANKCQLKVQPNLEKRNLKYLEQLLVLVLFGSSNEKNNYPTKKCIVKDALAALADENRHDKHNKTIGVWWKAIGIAPDYFSRLFVQWKLDSNSRPLFIRKLAKSLRG